ncbi:MAG: HAMP domain-containing histidine kinase [Planctomycetes bacterium]|nr:HAMP domain-containing histidine kinase [Planctomycetota bacterium]
MRKHSLRTSVTVRLALLALAIVAAVALASNVMISGQFEAYVKQRQKKEADAIADNIASLYRVPAGGWNLDYIHGMGMHALHDGFIIKLHDRDGKTLWDAEHHDMTLCHAVMDSIAVLMRKNRPELHGEFVTHRYALARDGRAIGSLDISYYGPYQLNENDYRFLAALNRILLAVGAASLAAAAVMGAILARGIARPIRSVAALTRKIADGDYQARFQEDVGSQELHEMTRAVNHMAQSLAEQELLRKRLTSDVTHELRTPVANVASYLEMMQDGVMEPTPERLRSCYDELQRLSGLISDLERLRQIESEDLARERAPVDLLGLARTVLRNFASELRDKRLSATASGDAAVVAADRGRLQQVVTNLVANAVHYSNPGGGVRVLVADAGDRATLRVEDDGIGIPQEDLGRIFARFYRTDQSRARRSGGAGIGLTIVKAIVQAHGGTIAVESEAGHGSAFTVTLPKG